MRIVIDIALAALVLGFLYFVGRKLYLHILSAKQKKLTIDDTPSSVVSIEKIAELTTATYFDEKVIVKKKPKGIVDNKVGEILASMNKDGQPILEDEICMIAKATIRAGYDFTELTPESFNVRNGVLYLRLPSAKILDVISNPADWEYFAGADKWSYDQTLQIEEETKELFTKEAIENGILKAAEENGRNTIKMIFLSLNYKDVVLE